MSKNIDYYIQFHLFVWQRWCVSSYLLL